MRSISWQNPGFHGSLKLLPKALAMRAFKATTTRGFGLRFALPAVLIVIGTLAAVVLSLAEITSRAERVEGARLSRAAQAAIAGFIERVGDAHEHCARADLTKAAPGRTGAGFLASATAKGTLFDTA
jgi:hypothetical protein